MGLLLGYEMNDAVAWMDGRGRLYHRPEDADRGQTMRPLYFAQPMEWWIELSDEEIRAASKGHMSRLGFARAVENKLKEKNA